MNSKPLATTFCVCVPKPLRPFSLSPNIMDVIGCANLSASGVEKQKKAFLFPLTVYHAIT
jgi:hypothetical protein